MKVKHKLWFGTGRIVIDSIGGAVQRRIGQVGGHGYGQVEQLQAELNETQIILGRLCDIIGESMTREDVHYLLDTYDNIDVAEHFCAACHEEAQGNYSINRDGNELGPMLDLCDRCGESDSMEEIRQKIAERE